MNKHRRVFLKAGLAASLVCTSGRLYAAPVAGPRLLVVFLRGGYDSNSFLVPYASSDYYEARPTIALRSPTRTPTPVRSRSMPTGRWRPRCEEAWAPCMRSGRRFSYRSLEAMTCPAAILKRRTALR